MRTREALAALAGALAAATQAPASVGIEDDDYRTAAWWFLQAELLDLPDFGFAMAEREIQRLRALEPALPLNPAPGLIDATYIPGHVALAAAVRRIIAGRHSAGVHAIALRNVGALGIMGSAVRELALHGLVGLAVANSAPIVAPWGGTAAAIGTNPIAAAAPRLGGGALVVDFATSSLTVATLRRHLASGDPLPPPGGLDAHGEPTATATAVRALLPASLDGSLSAFVVELLTGVSLGRDWHRGRSAVVLALDPAYFGTDGAAQSEEFARTWVEAGGHLPARFDSLPTSVHGAPETLEVAEVDFRRRFPH